MSDIPMRPFVSVKFSPIGRTSSFLLPDLDLYTAEGRVDFRELVRDLAAHFCARIEMRQIGVRDEARMLGGYGACGSGGCGSCRR